MVRKDWYFALKYISLSKWIISHRQCCDRQTLDIFLIVVNIVDWHVLPPARAAPSLVFRYMNRYMHFFYDWHMYFFVDRNVLINWYMFVYWNFFNMMMMNGMNVVGNMNNNVLTANKIFEKVIYWINTITIYLKLNGCTMFA